MKRCSIDSGPLRVVHRKSENALKSTRAPLEVAELIPATEEIVRFGLFELELKTGVLHKNGIRIRLHQQPLQVLALLLERSGEVVTRLELQQRLWSGDVFVDFDHGLNKSVQKLREALGDSADSSRYIETIPRVGYRFIAPVRRVSPPSAQQPSASPYFETAAAPALAAPAPDTEPGPNPSSQRWILVIAGVSIAVMLTFTAAIWLAHRRPPAGAPIHSLAVLPLVNLSGDPAQEYFADGMTDELTTMLAKNSTLQITSRTSVMQYKGVRRPLREVATALGVDGILEGSISRSGDKVHMTIQLIQAPTDTHVWAESYDRSTNDAVSLPLEAAQAIARRLNTAVPQPAPRYVSPEAHDAYLHGRYLWYAGKDDAKNYFEKATQLQPDYALGWSGLADYYGAAVNVGRLKPSESFAPFEAAARKAVELDDSLSEAHNSMAAVYLIVHWDWVRADQEAQRAIQLDPRSAEAGTSAPRFSPHSIATRKPSRFRRRQPNSTPSPALGPLRSATISPANMTPRFRTRCPGCNLPLRMST